MSRKGTGYRNPPEHAKFKKGASGNPKGRPKGSRNLQTIIEAELNKKITYATNGRKRTRSKRELIVERAVMDAIKGDARARALVLQLALGFDNLNANAETAAPSSETDKKMLARLATRMARHAGSKEDGDA